MKFNSGDLVFVYRKGSTHVRSMDKFIGSIQIVKRGAEDGFIELNECVSKYGQYWHFEEDILIKIN